MTAYDDMIAKMQADMAKAKADIDTIVASLTPDEQSAWAIVLADHEYFDGEYEIERDVLKRWLKRYRVTHQPRYTSEDAFEDMLAGTFGRNTARSARRIVLR